MLELSEKIKDHFRQPRNVGEMERPDATGAIENPVCGDITKLYLRIKDGMIEDAKFLSFGCAVTIASASVFTERIRGKEVSKLLSGSDVEVIERLIQLIERELGEIPSVKLHCPPATVQVFLEAVADYFVKKGDSTSASRLKGLIEQVSKYYRRGEEDKS